MLDFSDLSEFNDNIMLSIQITRNNNNNMLLNSALT